MPAGQLLLGVSLPPKPLTCPCLPASPPPPPLQALTGPTGGVMARNRLMAMQQASSEERTFRLRQSHLSSQSSAQLGLSCLGVDGSLGGGGGGGGGVSALGKGDFSPGVSAAAAPEDHRPDA